MNQRLKEMAQRGGMPLHKVQALIDHAGGDERWVESILQNASAAEKSAMLAGVSYKADDGEYDDAELTLSSGDLAAIKKMIVEVVQQQGTPTAPVKARVLADSGPQSSFPTTKAYRADRDPYAVLAGSDQSRRAQPATKAATVSLESLIKGSSWDGR